MKKMVFKSIKKGLEEAVDHALGKGKIAKLHVPKNVDVKSREKKRAVPL